MGVMQKRVVCAIAVACVVGVANGYGAAAAAAMQPRMRSWELDLLGEHGVDLGAAGSGPVHEAGYFKLNRTHEAEMFYFYFENRQQDEDAPLVLWMTGGPGCSSELAIFVENGPYHIEQDLSLSSSKYGWDTVANLIYVDQPINTGFSYSDDPQDTVHYSEVGVANDMLDFLLEFMDKYPQYKGRPFFVTGESYAGHYVPAVSSRIFKAINNGEVSSDVINLQGFAIGNGLTQPDIQYGAYAPFSLSNKLISKELAESIETKMYPPCKKLIEECSGTTYEQCMVALNQCQNIVGEILQAAGNINVYNVHEQCTYPPLCYDFSRVANYLNLPETRKRLGVGNRKWESCSDRVHTDMMGDWMVSLEPVIPPMLEAGIRALVYAGDLDFICNWVGNQKWTLAMPWSGQDAFNDAAKNEKTFTVDGASAGSAIEVDGGPLSFLRVFDAGHMVPMDKPRVAQEMLARFLANKPF